MASPMLAPMIKFRYTDNNGNALVGGKVYTSISGTNTPLETYADPNGDAFNTNPVILDARGEADIWLLPGKKYRFTVKDSNDVLIEITDKVIGSSPAGIGQGWLDVKAFGATGDGVTDDGPAFQAAINACNDLRAGIYVPAGRYRIDSTLVAPTQVTPGNTHYFQGIRGDSSNSSILDFTNLSVGHALHFTNVPVGSIYQQFKVIGPGYLSGGSHSGLYLDGNGSGDVDHTGVYNVTFRDVGVFDFPQHGFYWEVPFVTVMDHLVAQDIGGVGFYVNYGTDGPWVGGTSLTFTSCYANHCMTEGYHIEPLVYSNLISCACDNSLVGYALYGCSSIALDSCGYELGNVTDFLSSDVKAIKIRGPSGVTGESVCLTINAFSVGIGSGNVNSFVIADIDAALSIDFNNCHFYYNMGAKTPTHEVIFGSDTSNNVLHNCLGYSEADSYSGKWRFTSAGVNNVSTVGGIPVYDTPDLYGNSFYVTNGTIVNTADPGAGGLNLFQTALYDYPLLGLTNDGTINFGDGSAVTDTMISRASPGVVAITGTGVGNGSLSVDGALTVGTSIDSASLTTGPLVASNATINGALQFGGTLLTTGSFAFSGGGWNWNYVSATSTAGSWSAQLTSGGPLVNPTVTLSFASAYPWVPFPVLTPTTTGVDGYWLVTNMTTGGFTAKFVGTVNTYNSIGFNFFVILV